jgi:hypothetical protein
MTPATPANLRKLAARFQPSFNFSTGERFFPIQAESWLSHLSYAPWQPNDDAGIAPETDNPAGPHHRGTAILQSEHQSTPPFGIVRKGGGPNAAGRPLALSGNSEDSIGATAYRYPAAPDELFLSFGGWADPTLRAGNADYLTAGFSELASAMDPMHPWIGFEQSANRPIIWHPQPTAPTVYAEAEWAGMYARLDASPDFRAANGNRSSFGGVVDADALEKLLVITYHLLFPMRDVGGDPGAVSAGNAEGQWEAVSLFFTGRTTGPATTGSRRPAFELDDTGPLAIAFSRSRRLDRFGVDAYPYFFTTKTDGGNPTVFVSLGAHRLSLFPPNEETPDFASGSGAGGAASSDTRLDATDPGKGDFPGDELLLVAGLALASPLLLLAWLISLFLGLNNEASTESEGPATGVPTPEGDGGGPIGAASEGAAPGTRLSDGTRVDDPALTILRFIDLLMDDPPKTSWPEGADPRDPPPDVEYPTWWDFGGRWGIEVEPGGGWSPGDRRIDRLGRTLGFFNAVRLADAWAKGIGRRP